MSLRLEPAPDNPNVVAVFYGPILLAGAEGKEGMTKPQPYGADQWLYVHDPVPASIVHELKIDAGNPANSFKPVAGEALTFTTAPGTAPSIVTLLPYYKIHDQRYVMYWDVKK